MKTINDTTTRRHENVAKCCDLPNFYVDTHSGERVCTSCGIVDAAFMFFEDLHPDKYSETCAQVNSCNQPCQDDKDPFNAHQMTRTVSNNRKQQRWLDRMNATVSYTSKQRIAWKLRAHVSETIEHLNISANVIEDVNCVLNEWVTSGGSSSLSGGNRTGFVAACVYRAAQRRDETVDVKILCAAFCINKHSFFRGRTKLYDWNDRYHLCDWFIKNEGEHINR